MMAIQLADKTACLSLLPLAGLYVVPGFSVVARSCLAIVVAKCSVASVQGSRIPGML